MCEKKEKRTNEITGSIQRVPILDHLAIPKEVNIENKNTIRDTSSVTTAESYKFEKTKEKICR